MIRKKEFGFTLIEAILAGAIFLIIITSIIGLLQIESNSIIWLWNDSYVQTAMEEVYNYVNSVSCEEVNIIKEEIEVKIGKRSIPIKVEKKSEEIISGRIRWTFVLQAKLSRRLITREIIRLCP